MTDSLFSPRAGRLTPPPGGDPSVIHRQPMVSHWPHQSGHHADVVITVHGTPGPQGSKRHVGRGVMVESSKKVKPWRAAVEAAALDAMAGTRLALDGPLVVEMVFSLPRGKTVRRAHHTTYPDLSKLIRSTEDALTTAGVWKDDARVVGYHQPRKVYAGGPDVDALDVPGAVIRVWQVTADE